MAWAPCRRAVVGVATLAALLALPAAAPGASGATGAASAAGPPLQPWIWISPAELRRLPERGPAWAALRQIADEPMGHADIADQNSDHDVHVLAAALVAARTGSDRLRRKAAAGVMDAIGTERGGRTLALARGLVAYVVAADLIDLRRYRPAEDAVFRRWLRAVRTERLQPAGFPTLVATNERRPNNWGAHAGASRIAADVYLGDRRDLARAAAVLKGYLGDRRVYHGFDYGSDRSWQARPSAPVGLNPRGAVRSGHAVGGVLPDDMRRGCSLRFPPCRTQYPWEALQGLVVQAEILRRQGYDAWSWGDQALRRAAEFLLGLHARYGAQWAPPRSDGWIPWLLNARYGTRFPARAPAPPGKGMGFTDWTAGGPGACHARPVARCSAPRGPRRTVTPIAAAAEPRGHRGSGGGGVPAAALAGGAAALALALLAATALALSHRHRVSGRPR